MPGRSDAALVPAQKKPEGVALAVVHSVRGELELDLRDEVEAALVLGEQREPIADGQDETAGAPPGGGPDGLTDLEDAVGAGRRDEAVQVP